MRILLLVFVAICPFGNITATDKYPMEEGFADANGLLIYYMQVWYRSPSSHLAWRLQVAGCRLRVAGYWLYSRALKLAFYLPRTCKM